MKNKNYYVPLMLIFCLFFLWAISSNLLPTMIRQLMKTCELNAFEASFTETAYWLAYFICPIPIAMFMKKYSYKSGIIFGLLLAACGGLLFFPAAMLKEYWAYLCIFFIFNLLYRTFCTFIPLQFNHNSWFIKMNFSWYHTNIRKSSTTWHFSNNSIIFSCKVKCQINCTSLFGISTVSFSLS